MNEQILIVDDEPNVRLSYRITLETEGYLVTEAKSGSGALELAAVTRFDLIILDLRMPEMDGLALLEELRKRSINTPTVLITAYGSIPDAVRAFKMGAIDFLQKPLTPEALRALVKDVVARHATSAAASATPEATTDFHTEFTAAQRDINNRDFAEAWKRLTRALAISPHAPEALNLAGVYFEMHEDFERAKKLYGKAIKYGPYYEPAQQNMRRIFDLFHFGTSPEPFHLGDTQE